MARRKIQTGFTLLELMVVIAIVAIMAAIAAPLFTGFINQNRLTRVKIMLANDLNRARSDAITSNARVVACPSNSTATDCSGTTDWAGNGWLICQAGSATNCNLAASAVVVRPVVANGITMTGSAGAIFTPSGTAASAQTINLTGASGTLPSAVSVAQTGAVAAP